MAGLLRALVNVVLVAGFLGFIFWFVRNTLRRSGGQAALNPFQPGWSELRRQYESVRSVRPLETVEGQIGTMRDFQIGFDTDELIISKPFSSTNLVRIPYRDIELLQKPEKFQATRLSEVEHSPGLFRAGGVRIFLPAYWAQQLQQRIEAAAA